MMIVTYEFRLDWAGLISIEKTYMKYIVPMALVG